MHFILAQIWILTKIISIRVREQEVDRVGRQLTGRQIGEDGEEPLDQPFPEVGDEHSDDDEE